MAAVEPDTTTRLPSADRSFNINKYATKKTITQGMLDIALLTANVSQLKYVLQVGQERHPFYTILLTLIILSLVLQVIAGLVRVTISLLLDCRIHLHKNFSSAEMVNSAQTTISAAIALINFVISLIGPTVQPAQNITVGLCFLVIGFFNINLPSNHRKADYLNNAISIQLFFISFVNVVISAFGIETSADILPQVSASSLKASELKDFQGNAQPLISGINNSSSLQGIFNSSKISFDDGKI